MQMSWDQLKANKHTTKLPDYCEIQIVYLSYLLISFMKGWAATVVYNPKAKAEFGRFQQRDDTLSLGVCNGCQLLALLGWVGESEDGAGKRKEAETTMGMLLITLTTRKTKTVVVN